MNIYPNHLAIRADNLNMYICREAATARLCREACFRYTIESEICLFVCLYVCMYVRTNEMSAQMKLQNLNFKNKDTAGIDLDTTSPRVSFTTIQTTPTNIMINLSIWTKTPDQ